MTTHRTANIAKAIASRWKGTTKRQRQAASKALHLAKKRKAREREKEEAYLRARIASLEHQLAEPEHPKRSAETA